MAMLAQDDKLQQNQGQSQDPSQGQTQGQQGASPLVNSGGGVVSAGNPLSTAGVGAGGGGGWTNIQAYLNANKGDQSTANVMKSQIGGQLDNEQQDWQKSASDAKSQAQSQVGQIKGIQDTASQIIQQAGQGAQDAGSKLKGLYQTQYQGPTSFQHGFQDKTQQYQTGLDGNQSHYQGMMENLYKDASGGRIGRGALNLQRQLDFNNDAVTGTRDELSGRAKALHDMALGADEHGGLLADTNNALKSAQDEFSQGKQGLTDYLNSQRDAFGNQIAADDRTSQEADDATRQAQEAYESGIADPTTGVNQAKAALYNSAYYNAPGLQQIMDNNGGMYQGLDYSGKYNAEMAKLKENQDRIDAAAKARDSSLATLAEKKKAALADKGVKSNQYSAIKQALGL